MLDPSADRFAMLEHRLARLTAIAAVLTVGLLLSVAWQLLPHTRVDAQEFMLRDSIGTWRGALMMREDGSPVVRLNDARGKARFYGVVLPDGNPRLRLTDSSGVHRAILELDQYSRPALRLMAEDGTLAAVVSVDSAGFPRAEFRRGALSRVVTLESSPAPAPVASRRP